MWTPDQFFQLPLRIKHSFTLFNRIAGDVFSNYMNTHGLWSSRSFIYFLALLSALSSACLLLHRYPDLDFISFTHAMEIFVLLVVVCLTLYLFAKYFKKYSEIIKSHTKSSSTSKTLSPQANSLSLFRTEVLEFHNDQRQCGEIARVQPLSKTISIWFFIGTITLLSIFLLFAPYSRKETVRGYLKPPAGSARVLATQVGTVSALYVREGESVQVDQPLISISSPQVDKDGADVNTSILEVLNKQKETIYSQISAEEIRTQTERRRLQDLLEGLSQEVTHFQTQLETQKERIKISEELVETANVLKGQGYISSKELGERKIGLLDHQLSVDSLSQQMIARKNEIIEKKASLEELPIIAADRIRQLKADLSSTEQRISEVKARSAYILRAPIAGRISSLPATLGQPAEPGRLLLTIIPEGDPLEAELFVPTRAAGFVKPGQRIRILYDAFPYQHYGTHGGKVSKMSQTMLTKIDVTGPIPLEEPAYRVTATLDRPDIESEQGKILLQPDMLLRADIVLDRRPLLAWIFNPIWGAGKRQMVQ